MQKRDVSESELKAYRDQERAILVEQNSTNWPLAEESLKRANRRDPENQLVMEYLCALYSVWKDPLDEENNRVDEVKQWFERLAEVHPEHKYANFYCGMIASTQGRRLLPNYGRFPRPPETEEDRRFLRMKEYRGDRSPDALSPLNGNVRNGESVKRPGKLLEIQFRQARLPRSPFTQALKLSPKHGRVPFHPTLGGYNTRKLILEIITLVGLIGLWHNLNPRERNAD